MPALIPYRLTFPNGLHIGTSGLNLEEAGQSVPSDTLFAALVDVWRRKFGNVEAFLSPFVVEPVEPPFLLTSAFPFVGGIRFYPMPADIRGLFSPGIIQSRGKELQRIRYWSETLVRKALEGNNLDLELFPEDELEEPIRGASLQGGSMWFSMEEHPLLPKDFQRLENHRHALHALRVWSIGRVPRVTVGRINSASNLFHAGKVTFAEGCGLWFGVNWFKPDLSISESNLTNRQAFDQVLSMLQDDGLGGERTAGYGAFRAETGDLFTLGQDPQTGKLVFLLSRYHPRKAELPAALNAHLETAYRLEAVGGWLRSPDGPAQRRKRVYLVSEGSLVSPPTFPAGDLCEVQPTYQNKAGDLPHKVFRYGLACAFCWPERSGRS